jgi:hypothetical protein
MTERGITLVMRVRNAMARGLSGAGQALSDFGKSAMRIGRAFTTAFLAAGAAVAGFAAKALQAYGVQEAAEKSLESALRAHGDELKTNMQSMKAYAAAIQDETGVADHNILLRMARLRMLGVEADQLDAAAKATIALKAAGMEEDAAIKAVAMARQGQYTMLQRYIPALRDATSEAEKAAIVNDFLTRGYAQQKDQLQTVAGQWGLLKNRVGDLWEELGRVIAQNESVTNGLRRAGEAVKAFGQRINEWAAGGGVTNATATFKLMFEEIRFGFLRASNAAHVAFSAMGDGADTAANFVIEKLKAMGRVAVAVFEALRSPSKAAFAAIKDAALDVAAGTEIITRRTDAALATRADLEREHAARVAAIAQEQTDRLSEIGKERAANAEADLERISIAEGKRVDDAEANARRLAELEREKEQIANEMRARMREQAQEAIRLAQDELRKKEEIARQTVAALLAEVNAKKDLAKQQDRDERKAKRLEDMQNRGVRLNRRQQEFLDAARQVREARDPVLQNARQAALDRAKGEAAAAEVPKKTLEELQRHADQNQAQIDLLRQIKDAAPVVNVAAPDVSVDAPVVNVAAPDVDQDAIDAQARAIEALQDAAAGGDVDAAADAVAALQDQQARWIANSLTDAQDKTAQNGEQARLLGRLLDASREERAAVRQMLVMR